jgi:hypothetical protein
MFVCLSVRYAFGPCNTYGHQTFHDACLGPKEGRRGVKTSNPGRVEGGGLGEIHPGYGIWEFFDPTDSRRHQASHGTPLSSTEGREGVAISKGVVGGRRFSENSSGVDKLSVPCFSLELWRTGCGYLHPRWTTAMPGLDFQKNWIWTEMTTLTGWSRSQVYKLENDLQRASENRQICQWVGVAAGQ